VSEDTVSPRGLAQEPLEPSHAAGDLWHGLLEREADQRLLPGREGLRKCDRQQGVGELHLGFVPVGAGIGYRDLPFAADGGAVGVDAEHHLLQAVSGTVGEKDGLLTGQATVPGVEPGAHRVDRGVLDPPLAERPAFLVQVLLCLTYRRFEFTDGEGKIHLGGAVEHDYHGGDASRQHQEDDHGGDDGY